MNDGDLQSPALNPAAHADNPFPPDVNGKAVRITHHYDIGNQDVFVERCTGDVDPIGVDDGGVAAAVFSRGWDEEWPAADATRRRAMMGRYIALECFYAPSLDNPEFDGASALPMM